MVTGKVVGNLVVNLAMDSAEFVTGMDNATKKTSSFASGLMKIFAAAGTAMAAAGAYSVKQYMDFEEQINKATTAMGDVSDATRKRMMENAMMISSSSKSSSKEIASAYNVLASAGYDAEGAIVAVAQAEKFAVATSIDLDKATKMLANSQVALGLKTNDAKKNQENLNRISDAFVKTSKLANIEVEELGDSFRGKLSATLKTFNVDMERGLALITVFSNNGYKGAEAADAVASSLMALDQVSQKNANMWKRMGLNIYDSSGKMRMIEDIIGDLEKKFAGLTDAQRRNTLELLGFQSKQISYVNTLIGNSSKVVEAYGQIKNAVGETSKDAEKNMGTTVMTWNKFINNINNAAISIGEKLAPQLNELWESFDKNYIKTGKLQEVIVSMAEAAAKVLGALIETVKTLERAGKGVASLTSIKDADAQMRQMEMSFAQGRREKLLKDAEDFYNTWADINRSIQRQGQTSDTMRIIGKSSNDYRESLRSALELMRRDTERGAAAFVKEIQALKKSMFVQDDKGQLQWVRYMINGGSDDKFITQLESTFNFTSKELVTTFDNTLNNDENAREMANSIVQLYKNAGLGASDRVKQLTNFYKLNEPLKAKVTDSPVATVADPQQVAQAQQNLEKVNNILNNMTQIAANTKTELAALVATFSSSSSQISSGIDNINFSAEEQAKTIRLLEDLLGNQAENPYVTMSKNVDLLERALKAQVITVDEYNRAMKTMKDVLMGSSKTGVEKMRDEIDNLNTAYKSKLIPTTQEYQRRVMDVLATQNKFLNPSAFTTDTKGNPSGSQYNPWSSSSQLGGNVAQLEQMRTQQAEILKQFDDTQKALTSSEQIGQEERLKLEKEALAQREKILRDFKLAQASIILDSANEMFGSLSEISKEWAGEQSGVYKVMFAMSKAFAIADATVKIAQGIASAATAEPWYMKIPAMASIAAATAGIVSNIRSVQMASFEGGGMTPDGPRLGGVDGKGGKYAILHPNEKVTDLKNGGEGGNNINIIIHNNVSDSVQVSAAQDEEGQVQILVDKVESKIASTIKVGAGKVPSAMQSAYPNLRRGSK